MNAFPDGVIMKDLKALGYGDADMQPWAGIRCREAKQKQARGSKETTPQTTEQQTKPNQEAKTPSYIPKTPVSKAQVGEEQPLGVVRSGEVPERFGALADMVELGDGLVKQAIQLGEEDIRLLADHSITYENNMWVRKESQGRDVYAEAMDPLGAKMPATYEAVERCIIGTIIYWYHYLGIFSYSLWYH
jgi:hypothetical protein